MNVMRLSRPQKIWKYPRIN